MKSAARLVGSHSDTEFDIRFNPDVFTPDLKSEDGEEQVKKQKELIKGAAAFLLSRQIPTLVSRDCCCSCMMSGDK